MKNTEKGFVGKAFLGIDVHKNSWKVCVLGKVGFRKEFSCDPETKVLMKSLQNMLPNFLFDCALYIRMKYIPNVTSDDE